MTPPSWLVTHGGALALGLLVGWFTNGWRLGEQIAQTEATAEHERAEAFRWVVAEQTRSAADMALADTNALIEVRREQEKIDQLRDCIERGAGCGLRVKVARPAACVSEADTATGVGDRGGEWAELDRGTALRILRLESGIRVAEQALKLCVDRYPK